MGCDVGSGMIHWIPKKSIIISENTEQNKPVNTSSLLGNVNITDTTIGPSIADAQNVQVTSSVAPIQPVSSSQFIHPVSLLQSQYQSIPQPQSQTQSLSRSPSEAPPVVNVNVPSSRPVIDNLDAPSVVPTTLTPTSSAPPMAQYFNHPHNQVPPITQPQGLSPVVPIDDMPLPNFKVPSDIVNQN